VGNPQPPFGPRAFQVPAYAGRDLEFPIAQDDGLHGVRVAAIQADASEGPLVYEPGIPTPTRTATCAIRT
jgi:flagellar basal body rod protein FlgC